MHKFFYSFTAVAVQALTGVAIHFMSNASSAAVAAKTHTPPGFVSFCLLRNTGTGYACNQHRLALHSR